MFDANTYLLMTKALDYFDPARHFGGKLSKHCNRPSKFLVVSFTSDWRFRRRVRAKSSKALLDAKRRQLRRNRIGHGHDAFLMTDARNTRR